MLRIFGKAGFGLVLLFCGGMAAATVSGADEVSEVTSWFTVNRHTLLADGKLRGKITVFLRDKECDPVKGKQVIIKSSRDSLDKITQRNLSNRKGKCVGYISSTTPGAVSISVICEGTVIRENMISNGSAEIGKGDKPAGWGNWSTDRALSELSWAESIAHSGNRSLKVVSLDEKISSGWKPGFSQDSLLFKRDYVFSAWIKTEVVESDAWGICLNIGQRRKVGETYPLIRPGGIFYAGGVKGTKDWQKKQLKFKLHPEAYSLSLALMPFVSSGIAWFDDVRLEVTPTIIFE